MLLHTERLCRRKEYILVDGIVLWLQFLHVGLERGQYRLMDPKSCANLVSFELILPVQRSWSSAWRPAMQKRRAIRFDFYYGNNLSRASPRLPFLEWIVPGDGCIRARLTKPRPCSHPR